MSNQHLCRKPEHSTAEKAKGRNGGWQEAVLPQGFRQEEAGAGGQVGHFLWIRYLTITNHVLGCLLVMAFCLRCEARICQCSGWPLQLQLHVCTFQLAGGLGIPPLCRMLTPRRHRFGDTIDCFDSVSPITVVLLQAHQ